MSLETEMDFNMEDTVSPLRNCELALLSQYMLAVTWVTHFVTIEAPGFNSRVCHLKSEWNIKTMVPPFPISLEIECTCLDNTDAHSETDV